MARGGPDDGGMRRDAPADRAIEAPLRALRRRVRLLFLVEGVARVLAVLALLVGAAFGLDIWLHLPAAIRLVHFVAIGACTAVAAWRWIVFPLRRPLTLDDMALQVEATHPNLDDRLVSALQLSRRARADRLGNTSPELVGALVDEAKGLLDRVRSSRAVGARPALRRTATGFGLVFAVVVLLAASPENTRVWYERALGADVAWPQRTVLRVVLPTRNPNLFVRTEETGPVVSLARGTDLLVRAIAQGVTPSRVILHLETPDGARRERETSRRGEDEFLYRFRSVVDPFAFHVTGGDDVDRHPTVRVEVLTPPEIEGFEARYRFPEYTGLPPVTRSEPDLEGPVGTEVDLHVRTNLPVAEATIRLGSGEETQVALERVEATRFSTTVRIEASTTYSIALVADNGLRNLDPGLYAIRAVPDRIPTLKILSPLPVDGEWTAQASLPIRALATDDFGVHGMELRAWTGGDDPPVSLWRADGRVAEARKRHGSVLVDLRQVAGTLAGTEAESIREGFVFRWIVEAWDGRPQGEELHRGRGPEGRIEVIGTGEFHRKWMERQIRMKEELALLRKQQATLLERVQALVAAPETSAILESELSQGQIVRKLRASLESLVRLFEAHLYNRTETSPQAENLLRDAFALAVARQESDEGEDMLAYAIAVAESLEGGRYGSLDVLGRILAMIRVGSEAHDAHGPEALAELRAARTESEGAAEALTRAAEAQSRFLKVLDEVLARMEEWEDYQEILRLARELMDVQRDLEEQTRSALPRGSSPPPGG